MPHDKKQESENTTNWFFWSIIGLIALYYAFHFFIASSSKEQHLNETSTKELLSMVKTIKGREAFYDNLVKSWRYDEDNSSCAFFANEFNGRFDCFKEDSYQAFDYCYSGTQAKSIIYKEGVYYYPYYGCDRLKSEEYVDDFNQLNLPIGEFFDALLTENSQLEGYSISELAAEKNSETDTLQSYWFEYEKEYLWPPYNSSPFQQVLRDSIQHIFKQDSSAIFVRNVKFSVGSMPYRGFSTKFKLEGYANEFLLIGYVSDRKWLGEVKELDFHGTLIFGGIILIIILLIPHLRILGLSKTDRLGYEHAVRLFVTLLIIIPVVFVMARYSYESVLLKANTKTWLEDQNDNRLTQIGEQFKNIGIASDSLLRWNTQSHSFPEKYSLTEYLKLDSNGTVASVEIFETSIATEDHKDLIKNNNLAYRPYYQEARKDRNKTVLEILKSVTSEGGVEYVFSTQQSTDEVLVLTTKIEDPYKDDKNGFYHVINIQGDIIYDSRHEELVSVEGNIFDRLNGRVANSEEDIEDLQVSGTFKVNYQNEKHLVKISRISMPDEVFGKDVNTIEPYYLVSFYDIGWIDSFHSSSLSVVSALYFAYLAFVLLLWQCLKFATVRRSKLERSMFSLPWLLPKNLDLGTYTLLFVMLLVLGVVEVFASRLLSWDFRSNVILVLFFTSLSGFVTYMVISKNKLFKKTASLIDSQFEAYKNKFKILQLSRKIRLRRSYGAFFVMWLMLFSYVPAWVIITRTHQYEKSILVETQHEKLGDYLGFRDRLTPVPSIKSSQLHAISDTDQEIVEASAFEKIKVPVAAMLFCVAVAFVGLYFYQMFIFRRMYFDFDFEFKPIKPSSNKQWLHLKGDVELRSFIALETNWIDLNGEEKEAIEALFHRFKNNLNEEVAEYIVIAIQDILHTKYELKWGLLTPTEKFLLYDLAEDGCMNATNKYPIISLIEKGYIHYDTHSIQGPEVVNKSFQNYILINSGEDEALLERIELSKKGKWGKSRTIVLAITLLLFFLSFTVHEQILEQILAVATGAIAVMPTVLGGMSNIQLPKFGGA